MEPPPTSSRGVATAAALAVALAASLGARTPDAWERADAATLRLEPEAFRALPAPLRRELTRRGCRIPQSSPGSLSTSPRPHNVISGRFRKAGQVDWAVLCSRNRASSILVFWGGSVRDVDELAASPDRAFLQVTGPGIRYSRLLAVASPAAIQRYHQAHGGPDPPRLAHDGIDDHFQGKASVVRYWAGGRWLELTGAD